MSTYLLETIRVTSQSAGERNYHVFYEIYAGLSDDRKAMLNLSHPITYRYTSGHQTREDGESDQENCSSLISALQQIGLTSDVVDQLCDILVAILCLGNINLVSVHKGDGQYITEFDKKNQDDVNNVCQLLQVSSDSLLGAMTRSSMELRKEIIVTVLGVQEATSARDTLAQKIYNAIFVFLIASINTSLSFDDAVDAVSNIGILDIFGFEFFLKNSFEQLCINYANETLQDHFNYAIFVSEKDLYEKEGLEWTVFDYPDNSKRIALFEDPSKGIFSICNDCQKGSKDSALANTLIQRCDKEFFETTPALTRDGMFTVVHYACRVTYSTAGFVEKNRIEVPQEMEECLRASGSELIRRLFPIPPTHPHSNNRTLVPQGAISKNKTILSTKKPTVAKQFTTQLKQLVSTIRGTRSHFIRCIKPNDKLSSGLLNPAMVVDQLRCGGAIGAVQVFRAGLPNRMSFEEFSRRYGVLLCVSGVAGPTRKMARWKLLADEIRDESLWRATAIEVLKNMRLFAALLDLIDNQVSGDGIDLSKGLQMGKSRLFMSAVVYEYIETLYNRAVVMMVTRLQRRMRIRCSSITSGKKAAVESLLYLCDNRRRSCRLKVNSAIFLQRQARIFLKRLRRFKAVFAVKIQRIYRGWRGRVLFARRKLEAQVRRNSPYFPNARAL
jgi:myosin V